jgi:small subunit ribosomal protein S5
MPRMVYVPQDEAGSLEERVVDIWRCAAVVKGGRRFSFAALVVVGNGLGAMGMGYAKAREVPFAIEKAVKDGRRRLVRYSLEGDTIPHQVRGRYGSAQVVLAPARPGTGIIAGSAVRAVCECLGIKDILTKSFGTSNNSKNLVKAAMEALSVLRDRKSVAELRGVKIQES